MTKRELIHEIERLKKEKNAIVLAHYYSDPDVQDITDFLGDSLELQELYDFWMPKVSLANEEYDKLFAWIDDNT